MPYLTYHDGLRMMVFPFALYTDVVDKIQNVCMVLEIEFLLDSFAIGGDVPLRVQKLSQPRKPVILIESFSEMDAVELVHSM